MVCVVCVSGVSQLGRIEGRCDFAQRPANCIGPMVRPRPGSHQTRCRVDHGRDSAGLLFLWGAG